MQTIKAGSNMKHPRYKRVKGHPIARVGRNRTWRGLTLPVDPYWVLHLLFLGTWPRNQVPGILVNRGEREPAECRFCGKQTHTTQTDYSTFHTSMDERWCFWPWKYQRPALHCKGAHWNHVGTLSTISGKIAFIQPTLVLTIQHLTGKW